ncbi:TPA: LysE family translocator, partial [Pseudomonas aeruginosa]
PKAWMMALAALALFAGEGAGQAGRIGLLALLFFLVSLPCLASWALLGVGSARLLRSPSLMKRFNQGMALLLLASAWAALLL